MDVSKVEVVTCINLEMLRASHYVMKVYDEAYRPYGVRATQLPVLNMIGCRGPIGMKALADATATERSVLSRKLQVMEENGWISVDLAAKGREKGFILTEQGRALVARVMPVRDRVQGELLSRLSPAEQALLTSLCAKLQGAAPA